MTGAVVAAAAAQAAPFEVGFSGDATGYSSWTYMYSPLRVSPSTGVLTSARVRMGGSSFAAYFFTIDPATLYIRSVTEVSSTLSSGGFATYNFATPIAINAGDCVAIAPYAGGNSMGLNEAGSGGLSRVRLYNAAFTPVAGATAPTHTFQVDNSDACLLGYGVG